MSKTIRKVATDKVVTATIKRESTTKNSDGSYATAPSTIQAGVTGDLQPDSLGSSSDLTPEETGPVQVANHWFFSINRLANIKGEDLLTIGAATYRVLRVYDPGGTSPQSLYLLELAPAE
jgi:hypothetical protein